MFKTKSSFFYLGLLFLFPALLHSQSTSSFKTEVYGEGAPMILIPGLYCKGDVWKETVEHYKSKYECHVLTLAGFAGESAFRNDSILFTVKNEIALYIKQRNLNNPVIIGHSLGGFVALWLSSTYPDIAGPVVCVDAVPFLPGMILPDATAETSKDMAANMKKYMSNTDTSVVRANQKMYLPTMISDTNHINTVIEWAVSSHQPTIGQVMYEMYTTDLRNDIRNIKSPVLELGTWIAYKAYGATHESAVSLLKDQFKEFPSVIIAVNDSSRHFIMYDEPEWMFKQIDSFLEGKYK